MANETLIPSLPPGEGWKWAATWTETTPEIDRHCIEFVRLHAQSATGGYSRVQEGGVPAQAPPKPAPSGCDNTGPQPATVPQCATPATDARPRCGSVIYEGTTGESHCTEQLGHKGRHKEGNLEWWVGDGCPQKGGNEWQTVIW